MPNLQWGLFFADLNSVVGSEQAGRRPVLVVSRESVHLALPVVGICPLTSHKPGRRIYPTEVLIQAGLAGLNMDSLVLAHQFRTIAKVRLNSQIGVLKCEKLMEQIRQALKLFLDLDL
jgi:mRNA interferase MazF